MDADTFVHYITEDAKFRFANEDFLIGREAVRDAISGQFSTLQSLRHEVVDIWEDGDVIVAEMVGEYVTKDGEAFSIPVTDVFRRDGWLIKDYRIFTDYSPVAAHLSGGRREAATA
jgi:ketosteroid isomerase-like protein